MAEPITKYASDITGTSSPWQIDLSGDVWVPFPVIFVYVDQSGTGNFVIVDDPQYNPVTKILGWLIDPATYPNQIIQIAITNDSTNPIVVGPVVTMPFIEYTPNTYIESKCTALERIAAIDMIIWNNLTLISKLMTDPNGGGAVYQSYELNDGQVHIKTSYRSLNELIQVNKGLETLKQLYIQQANGRATVLRPKSTLRFPLGGWHW